ncbi:MAG TPA: hypothetical protein ACQGQI_01180 [Xylella sp.]
MFFVHDAVHPQTLEVLRMFSECYPDTFGRIGDHRMLAEAVHASGGVVAVASDLLALTLITPPGEWGG